VTPSSAKNLDQIADLIRGHRNVVLIRGHTSTDDLAADSKESSAMELSLRRASAVRDYLLKRGVAADTLRVVGSASFEPVILGAYTTDSQAMNRRVEVESTSTLVEDLRARRAVAEPVRVPDSR